MHFGFVNGGAVAAQQKLDHVGRHRKLPRKLAHQVLSAAPPASWIAEGLPPGLDLVIATALRKNPDHRYPTMDALRADLARLARVPPELVEPNAWAGEPDVYAPRTPHAAAAIAFLKARL